MRSQKLDRLSNFFLYPIFKSKQLDLSVKKVYKQEKPVVCTTGFL
jgi:hypothetical protein